MKPLIILLSVAGAWLVGNAVVCGQQLVMPRVVAHRGLMQHAPENTLASFRACLELRCGFEFDVAKTSDGHLVVIHDNTLERTTNGMGQVAEMPLTQLRSLDAGQWFDRKFMGTRVPTVNEVLQLVAEYHPADVLIAVDLKAENVEQQVVHLAEQHQVLNKLLFIGRAITESRVRENIRAASALAHVAVVAHNAAELTQVLDSRDADWIYVRYLPTRAEIDQVHRSNKRAFIAGSTVSGLVPNNWRQAMAHTIDGILTDYPLELSSLIRQEVK
jgi:glycerophosphoryl diester phosphodiesterase